MSLFCKEINRVSIEIQFFFNFAGATRVRSQDGTRAGAAIAREAAFLSNAPVAELARVPTSAYNAVNSGEFSYA
jgi:hypothetical protein